MGSISQCGDAMMRTMLFEAAQVMLTRSTKWSWLKAWAMKVARHRGHEEGDRRAGAADGGRHAPHVGRRHRVPLDKNKRRGRLKTGRETERRKTRSSADGWNDVPRGTMGEASRLSLGPAVRLTARTSKIVPPRLRIPSWEGLSADPEEKHEPVSDIDTAAMDSLKALDPNRPIREGHGYF